MIYSTIAVLLEISQCPAGGIIRNPRDPPCRALDVRKAGEGRRKRHVGLRPDGAAARHARADASSWRPRVSAGQQTVSYTHLTLPTILLV